MTDWTWGLTLTVFGMTGTLLSLMILGVLTGLLKRLFPLLPDAGPKTEKK